MLDIAIVTEDACLLPDPNIKYNATAIAEDGFLMRAFTDKNISCVRVAWEDPHFDWASVKIALIKTPWNYYQHIEAFKVWLYRTSQQCMVVNDKDLILWNLDKHYLFKLQKKGVDIPETHVLGKDSVFDPVEWHSRLGTQGMVVKPLVSAGAKDTYLFSLPWENADVMAVNAALQRQPMMVQPFISSIVIRGEISMVFIGGHFTHAVIKRPKDKDFRVQAYHGGTFEKYEAKPKEIDFGLQVLRACEALQGSLPVYARIDLCYGAHGVLLLMELEVIEPELWYSHSEKAVALLINSIKNLL